MDVTPFILTQDVTNAARALSIDPEGVTHLLRVFSALGALNCFAHVDGAADLVILEPQWLVDSMVCLRSSRLAWPHCSNAYHEGFR